VEKLEKFAPSFFRLNPLHRKSWLCSNGEGSQSDRHRQGIDLADTLAKIWNGRSTANFFAVFRGNMSFSTQSAQSGRSYSMVFSYQ
jgi:hypothetical protein